jgi:hypothetical protein
MEIKEFLIQEEKNYNVTTVYIKQQCLICGSTWGVTVPENGQLKPLNFICGNCVAKEKEEKNN